MCIRTAGCIMRTYITQRRGRVIFFFYHSPDGSHCDYLLANLSQTFKSRKLITFSSDRMKSCFIRCIVQRRDSSNRLSGLEESALNVSPHPHHHSSFATMFFDRRSLSSMSSSFTNFISLK